MNLIELTNMKCQIFVKNIVEKYFINIVGK